MALCVVANGLFVLLPPVTIAIIFGSTFGSEYSLGGWVFVLSFIFTVFWGALTAPIALNDIINNRKRIHL